MTVPLPAGGHAGARVRCEVARSRRLRAIALFLQRCINGLANGIIYSSVALALVIVYRATGLLNVAQGELATMSTYVSLVLHSPATPAVVGTGLAATFVPFSPWPWWAAIAGGMLAGALLGALTERLLIRRVSRKGGFAVISATVGLLLFVNGLTERIWRPIVRGVPSPFPNRPDDYFLLWGARLRYATIGTWAVVAFVLVGLFVVLKYTKLGLAFRAVSSSPDASALVGIRAGRVTTVGWALAGAIGALAGALVAPTVLLEPGMMVRVLIYALVAATVGGLDSLGGAIVGGLFIGLAQTMIGGYVGFLGAQLSLPGALVVMVAVLLYRPTGLFGTRRVERV